MPRAALAFAETAQGPAPAGRPPAREKRRHAVCTFAIPTGFSEKAFREPAHLRFGLRPRRRRSQTAGGPPQPAFSIVMRARERALSPCMLDLLTQLIRRQPGGHLLHALLVQWGCCRKPAHIRWDVGRGQRVSRAPRCGALPHSSISGAFSSVYGELTARHFRRPTNVRSLRLTPQPG